MDSSKLQSIHISDTQRQRGSGPFWIIVLVVLAITGGSLYVARPWAADVRDGEKKEAAPALATAPVLAPAKKLEVKAGDSALIVSGHIINRERIEVSPRTLNSVRWIGVKKGDVVKKDQVLVQLDDAEQKARIAEIDGQLAVAKIALDRARLNFTRVQKLRATQNETAEREDEMRLAVASAQAQIQQVNGARQIAQVYLDWTVIRSPIDGVVLEKLADPGELVSPQSFGGTRGPSTALVSLGDMNDLQVEADVSEGDLGKITLGQRCRVSPEAYAEKSYGGIVVEIAPEANRQKGTLQIKVQIENPDHFLTPELSAKVDFLKP